MTSRPLGRLQHVLALAMLGDRDPDHAADAAVSLDGE
jgi:hypothetical protein